MLHADAVICATGRFSRLPQVGWGPPARRPWGQAAARWPACSAFPLHGAGCPLGSLSGRPPCPATALPLQWLVAAGYPEPPLAKVDARPMYASRMYQLPPGWDGRWLGCLCFSRPGGLRGSGMMPVERGAWQVGCCSILCCSCAAVRPACSITSCRRWGPPARHCRSGGTIGSPRGPPRLLPPSALAAPAYCGVWAERRAAAHRRGRVPGLPALPARHCHLRGSEGRHPADARSAAAAGCQRLHVGGANAC